MRIRTSFLVSGTVLVLGALTLHLMGRVPVCTCGHISLWQGVVQSPENSQQLSDWYSASHFIHGILFFAGISAVVRWLWRREGTGWMSISFALATLIEVGWELLENSPVIIDRYRAVTVSWGYTGDSIINSVSDVLFMWAGFWFARYVPVWVSVLVVIVLELFVGYMIRDNLLLNIIMLIYPVPWINAWQAGG